MLHFYQAFLDRLEDLHKYIEQALDGLPQAALDWIPSEGMNSIDVMITHLTGAERYWIGDVAVGDASIRDRAAEFRVSGITADALRQQLGDTLSYARRVLEPLPLRELEQERISPRDGRKFSVSWALLHALEHTAIHLGHIQLTRQLWEKREG